MPCRKGNCPAFEMVGWAVPPDRCEVTLTIGMIDTKVNAAHEALRNQSIEIVNVRAKGDRESTTAHGTAIAALFVGDETSRTPGLLPNAKLVAVEAFHRDRSGDVADVYKIVRGLDVLAERGIRVVNLSFSGPENSLLGRAVDASVGRDMVLVAAAGNQGPKAQREYPAAYNGVLAVTAIDRNSKIYRQAVRGDHIAFAAPGVRLWTAAARAGGSYRSGTSYAAPFVSAAFAAVLARTPDISTANLTSELIERSLDLGTAGRDPIFGWGLIKAPPCGMNETDNRDGAPTSPP
jgi:subtilisin family serine protease